jgi:hypothetical protein
MSTKPLTRWSCDVCGDPVTADENDGYVVWRHIDGQEGDFRIIHKIKCDDDRYTSSLPLSNFLGSRGLATLTAFLSPGAFIAATYPKEKLNRMGFAIHDQHEFVDFFRRVQLPYYEEARSELWNPSEDTRELWADSGEVSPYLEESLIRIATASSK